MTTFEYLSNESDSIQLFVGVFDTFLVWYLLVLPSETYAIANMTSLRAIDGDTSHHSRESFSLNTVLADHSHLLDSRVTVSSA